MLQEEDERLVSFAGFRQAPPKQDAKDYGAFEKYGLLFNFSFAAPFLLLLC
jgi:hypothetical protein